jgi:cytoskeletal protein CcmA (bactofilin family)
MGIWKDQSTATKPPQTEPKARPSATPSGSNEGAARQAPRKGGSESLIAADIAIEGKIEGAGHVRIAGRFTGDIVVKGDLTIEAGAKVNGAVRASGVVIAGQLEGNIESATRVDLRDGGVLLGDVNAGSLTVAAGSRMRGQVEFGWEASPAAAAPVRSGSSAAA